MSDEASDWVEVRPAGSMGNGVFARKNIPRGTRIISETPFLEISNSSRDNLDAPAFCAAWNSLPKAEWNKFDRLHRNPTYETLETRAKVREWYKEQAITGSNGEVLKGKRLQDVSKATTKRFAIFLTNRSQMGYGGRYGSGLFLLFSQINHSCIPNTHKTYNPNLGHLTVHTIRDIPANEQLTISYIPGTCRTLSQRKEQLNGWGFSCCCQACTDDSIDLLRTRMSDLDQGLAAFQSPLAQMASRIQSLFAPPIAARMPSSKIEALSYAEELVKLLKIQGLEGMDLCHAYRDCSKYSLGVGNKLAALEYSHRELELERLLIGPETAHLREDMDGAEYWLEHLEQTQNLD